jgi:hypothetical protein
MTLIFYLVQVTALLGKTAYLNCRVKNLGNKTVSIPTKNTDFNSAFCIKLSSALPFCAFFFLRAFLLLLFFNNLCSYIIHSLFTARDKGASRKPASTLESFELNECLCIYVYDFLFARKETKSPRSSHRKKSEWKHCANRETVMKINSTFVQKATNETENLREL